MSEGPDDPEADVEAAELNKLKRMLDQPQCLEDMYERNEPQYTIAAS